MSIAIDPNSLPPLSDDLQSIIDAAARPLRPHDVPSFLGAIAEELRNHPQLGPGLIFRIARETQRRFFDPPGETHRGPRL